MSKQPLPVTVSRSLKDFLQLESSAGIILMGAAVLAMVAANSALAPLYLNGLSTPFSISLGEFGLSKPLFLWINDGLMAIFFLLIGLELKREIVEGELSSPSQVILPGAAAIGGLLVPAAIYWWINHRNAADMGGWAIPTATDIAFALGVLALLGSRIPTSLKILLTTIAVIDDLAAIVIIAVFYTADLSLPALYSALFGVLMLIVLNRMGVRRTGAYLLVGLFIWVSVLKSGVHATLAGVVTAFFIPLDARDRESPARQLEHHLHPWVAFMILPLFAFANAGISFDGIDFSVLAHGVPLGIFAGLVVGKQLGVMLAFVIVLGLGLGGRPRGVNWGQLYGVALLCGIGFTMSLFISTLAFEHGGIVYDSGVKLATLAASLVSAVLGWLVLRLSSKPNSEADL